MRLLLIRALSSAALRSHDTLPELAHRSFRLRVVDAHMIADLRLPVEQILEVRNASVRRLPLDDVASGLSEDDSAVDAALGLSRQRPGRVTQSLGSYGMCGSEGFRKFVWLARWVASAVFWALDGVPIRRRNAPRIESRPSRRLFCDEGAFLFQTQQVVRYGRSVMGGTEDFVLVLLQRLDPGVHVCGVLLRIVGDTALGGHKDTGQLRTQLFFRVIDIPETVGFGERGPIQAGWVSAEMCKFMENRAVIAGSISESLFGREMDAILSAIVECPVGLVMYHLCPGALQDLFTGLHCFKGSVLFRSVRGNSIHLLGIEDGVDAMDQVRLVSIRATVSRRAPFVMVISGAWPRSVGRGLDLPKLDLGALFSLAYLPAAFGGLSVGHPPRVRIAFPEAGGHQVNGVAATVGLARGRIHRHAERNGARLPGFLPWSYTLLQ